MIECALEVSRYEDNSNLWKWGLFVPTAGRTRFDYFFTTNWSYHTAASAKAAARRWAKKLGWAITSEEQS